MDIQREREVFEAIPEIKDKITSYKMDFVNGSYDSLFSHINAWMDGAWFLFQEKAKAQAVPEGFVIVPVRDLNIVMELAEDHRNEYIRTSEFTEVHKAIHDVKAMIEAQEQAND